MASQISQAAEHTTVADSFSSDSDYRSQLNSFFSCSPTSTQICGRKLELFIHKIRCGTISESMPVGFAIVHTIFQFLSLTHSRTEEAIIARGSIYKPHLKMLFFFQQLKAAQIVQRRTWSVPSRGDLNLREVVNLGW